MQELKGSGVLNSVVHPKFHIQIGTNEIQIGTNETVIDNTCITKETRI